ncbi:unnamed protein product [Medioppia subpectinata]|uniref:Uncharacterized protein n=1 Tax=Medioppia subpectinata TaxID=1979941 RepID=A0A7R9KFE7_9ACAR|nr:unnamed protein product [Medioppia subpectinata]CAG2101583.1 unnamed protein product [Medioppia subpectinata]
MAFSNQKTLTAVKIGLEVLYVLAIIGCIFLIVVCGIALAASDKDRQENNINKDQVTAALVIAALGLVISIVGLVGIVKENKCIVIVLLVLVVIGIISNFVYKEFGSALWGIVCAVLTAIYLYLIIQKDKETGPTEAPKGA